LYFKPYESNRLNVIEIIDLKGFDCELSKLSESCGHKIKWVQLVL